MAAAGEAHAGAVHMVAVNHHSDFPLRAEAMNPATDPARLDELTRLEGDRGDCDADAGWCREFVASNPSTSAETLIVLSQDMNDHLVRLGAARHANTPVSVLAALVADPNHAVSDAARKRLGLPPIPVESPGAALRRRLAGGAVRGLS